MKLTKTENVHFILNSNRDVKMRNIFWLDWTDSIWNLSVWYHRNNEIYFKS